MPKLDVLEDVRSKERVLLPVEDEDDITCGLGGGLGKLGTELEFGGAGGKEFGVGFGEWAARNELFRALARVEMLCEWEVFWRMVARDVGSALTPPAPPPPVAAAAAPALLL